VARMAKRIRGALASDDADQRLAGLPLHVAARLLQVYGATHASRGAPETAQTCPPQEITTDITAFTTPRGPPRRPK
jgi:hypothetical protein